MNSPIFTLKLSSSPLSIIAFHTRLEVNHDWTASIHVLSDVRLPNLLQQSAVIVSELNGAVTQLFNGVVVGMDNGWQTGDGFHYELTLRSLLVYLEMGKHNRVFVQDSVSDILPSVFNGTRIMASDYKLNSKQTLKPHPQLVQYKETDLDFFHRLLAYEGLQYTAGISAPAVQLYDNLQQLPTDATLILPYCDPKSTPTGDAVFTVSPRHCNLPTQVSYRSHNFQDPNNSLEVTATSKSKIGGRGKIVKADVGYLTEAEGQALVDRHMATLDAQREVFTLMSNCLDVTLGQVLQITGEPYITDLKNKFLRTVAIEHYYHDEHRVPERVKLSNIHTQFSGYHNRIIAIDAEHRYYSMTEVPVKYHGLLQAKVESTGGNNDQLDALGRYTVKFAFDENTHAKGAASTPMPAAQLSAGPNSGLHSPFVPGADVVVQCINGDLRQCVILGTLPTEDSPSTVSSSNTAQSLWQTPNAQSLLLDDSEYARTLRIATAYQQNTLEMSDSGTTVSTLQGDININAGHDYHEHIKQNLTATIGNNHTQQVQGNHNVSSNEGSITQQSGRDFNQLSQTSITQTAEQNIQSTAGNDMTTFAKNNILMQAQASAFTLQTAKDAINIHGANSIRIISQKGISIAQAGGLIQFDDQGNLTIQGNQIDLNYQNIDFSGNQTTSVASGQAADAPTVPVMGAATCNNTPTPVPQTILGKCDYYQFRHDDFVKRHANCEHMIPPSYYLDYGLKYCKKFSSELYPKLSSAGKTWLPKAKLLLQQYMEKGLAKASGQMSSQYADKDAPIANELNNEEFKSFAFNTHVPCYWKAGFENLSRDDVKKIAETLDISEMLDQETWSTGWPLGTAYTIDYLESNIHNEKLRRELYEICKKTTGVNEDICTPE